MCMCSCGRTGTQPQACMPTSPPFPCVDLSYMWLSFQVCQNILQKKCDFFFFIIKVVKIIEESHANKEHATGSLEHISRERHSFANTGAPSGAQRQVEHLI